MYTTEELRLSPRAQEKADLISDKEGNRLG